jgi:hypothetical protein
MNSHRRAGNTADLGVKDHDSVTVLKHLKELDFEGLGLAVDAGVGVGTRITPGRARRAASLSASLVSATAADVGSSYVVKRQTYTYFDCGRHIVTEVQCQRGYSYSGFRIL